MQWNPVKSELLLTVPVCCTTKRSILDTSLHVVVHGMLLYLAVLSLLSAATQQAQQTCILA